MTIKEIFKTAVREKASDVHLVANQGPILRIDGELKELKEKKISRKEMEQLIFSILSAEQKSDFLANKELDFGFENDDGARFRVNVYLERDNMALVARIISREIPVLKELDMPGVVEELLNLNQGLILVVGPTGCGKSTSLAAMVDYINKKYSKKIVTLEDPIEYVFSSEKSIIVQRQLGTDMANFTEGLKHVLRQDPNVIMVGEMRDLETISTAITLAETGHLVLATLHTYNAPQTIDRIIDIFPAHQQNQIRFQLSSILAGVISQRLIPKEGGGRAAAREVLINTPAVANLIRERKIAQIATSIETGSREGMISFRRDLERLYKEKIISKEVMQSGL
ncbi:MAG: PilT/PilU family type 4a pilus ATPase [Patescibacteria group bacterium]|jgi:twitching motility protein PilT